MSYSNECCFECGKICRQEFDWSCDCIYMALQLRSTVGSSVFDRNVPPAAYYCVDCFKKNAPQELIYTLLSKENK